MAEEKKPKKSTTTRATTAAKSTKVVRAKKAEKPVVKSVRNEKLDLNGGKDMSVAGFAVAVASVFTNAFTFGIMAIVGLVLSIIGRSQSAKAGKPNTLALAGIIISGIVMAVTFLGFLALVLFLVTTNAGPGFTHDLECESPMSRMSEECRDSPRSGSDEPLFEFQPNSI